MLINQQTLSVKATVAMTAIAEFSVSVSCIRLQLAIMPHNLVQDYAFNGTGCLIAAV